MGSGNVSVGDGNVSAGGSNVNVGSGNVSAGGNIGVDPAGNVVAGGNISAGGNSVPVGNGTISAGGTIGTNGHGVTANGNVGGTGHSVTSNDGTIGAGGGLGAGGGGVGGGGHVGTGGSDVGGTVGLPGTRTGGAGGLLDAAPQHGGGVIQLPGGGVAPVVDGNGTVLGVLAPAGPGANLAYAGPQGSSHIIAPDSINALRPAALGAYGSAAAFQRNAPIGVLGLVPGVGTPAGADGRGLLAPAALASAGVLVGGGANGGTSVVDTVADAISSVVDHLPDWSRPIIAALLMLVLLFGLRALFIGRRARKLEHARRSLSADVVVLQAALVPDLPERLGGVGLSVAYRPADGLASGGDFYDAFALDEHRVGIIIGDVSGHDRQAIARASAIRHKLRAYLELGLEPRMVLHAAGTALTSDSLDGDFATAAIAVHDAENGTLTYACAGHPAPIVHGAAGHAPVSVCSSPALGWGLPTGRRQTTVVLGEGDVVCFFTDGLIEARHNGAFLGRDGLERLAFRLDDHGTASDLLGDVIDIAHEAEDDLAALVIRAATPVRARAARLEEIEFDESDLQRKSPQRFLAACDAPAAEIERLGAAAEATVEQAGRGMLRVRFDGETGEIEASVEAVHAPAPRPRAVAL